MNNLVFLALIIIFSGLGLVYYIFLNTPKGAKLWSSFFIDDNIKKVNIISEKEEINNYNNSLKNTGIDKKEKNKNIKKVDNNLNTGIDNKKLTGSFISINKVKKIDTNINIFSLKDILPNFYKDFIPSQLPQDIKIFDKLNYKVYYNNHGFFLILFFQDHSCKDLFNNIIYEDKKLVEIEDKKVIISNTLPGDKICFFNIDKFYGKKVFMYIFGKKNKYFVIVDKDLYYSLKPYFQRVFK